MHVILSSVLEAFRLTHETLAEASCGDATAYTGKLHSLLCTNYVANTVQICPKKTEPALTALSTNEVQGIGQTSPDPLLSDEVWAQEYKEAGLLYTRGSYFSKSAVYVTL